MLPQTPEQWGAVLFAAGIIGGVVMALWTRWDYCADQTLRGAFMGAGVAYDDTELAEQIAEEEASIDDWLRLARVVGVVGDGSIYDRLVCEEIARQNGWAS